MPSLRLKTNRYAALFWILTLLLGLVFLILSFFGVERYLPMWRLVFLAILAHAIYAAAIWAAIRSHSRTASLWIVLTISLGLRLLLLPSLPVFSDDIYRYVWDGRNLISGINPYESSPAQSVGAPIQDAIRSKINNPEMKTIYPPMAEIFFSLIAALSPSVFAFKTVIVLADCANVLLIMLLAKGVVFSRKKQRPDCLPLHISAGLAYGMNPLTCIESGMSGHIDSLGVLAVLAAVLAIKRGRPLLASLFISIGAGIKLLPAAVLPMVRQKRLFSLLIFLCVMIALYLPFISVGESVFETTDAYLRRWEGNSGLFALAKTAFQGAIGAVTGAVRPDDMIYLKFLDPLASALQNTFFSLHKDGGFDPVYPGKFSAQDVSLAMTKILMTVIFVFAIVVCIKKKMEPIRALAIIFGTLMLVTPILHPWYLVWILPFAAILGIWPWSVLAALSYLAYLPLEGWWKNGIWSEPLWIPMLEYSIFAASFALYFYLRSHHFQLGHSE